MNSRKSCVRILFASKRNVVAADLSFSWYEEIRHAFSILRTRPVISVANLDLIAAQAEDDGMSDGGVVALTGFLYQLLASGAAILQFPEPNAVLAIEKYDEDATLIANGKEVVVQFKYSSIAEEIEPGTLAEILSNLEKHTTSTPTAEWQLTTNRRLSKAARTLYESSDNGHDPPNVSASNTRIIRRLRHRLEIKMEDFGSAVNKLRMEAKRYGLSNDEVEEGANRVVGNLLNRVVNLGAAAQITKSQVIRELVGLDQPLSLVAIDRFNDLSETMDRYYRDYVHDSAVSDSIPRDAMQRLFFDDEVVIVSGSGGSGKSTAVLRAVYDYIIREQKMAFALSSESPYTIESRITSWRSSAQVLQHEPVERCFQRLTTANDSATAPFLYIILDGYEEEGWNAIDRRDSLLRLKDHIRDSPLYKQGRPRPKIIVTTRDARTVRMSHRASFESENLDKATVITLTDFSETELRDVWRLWFPTMPFPRSSTSLPTGLETVEDQDARSSRLSPEIMRLLASPVFLKAFQMLFKKDRSRATDLINGDVKACAYLLTGYFNWFVEKVKIRSNIDVDCTIGAIRTVADAHKYPGPFEKISNWIKPITDKGWLKDRDASRLFENAVSCGLIETTQAESGQLPAPGSGPEKWFWRYKLVRDFLANQL